MSVSNPAEAELRELVAKTLEEKGVIGKVKVTELSRRSVCLHNSYAFTGSAKSECIPSTPRSRFFNGERNCVRL